MRGLKAAGAGIVVLVAMGAAAAPVFASNVSTPGSQLVFTGTSADEQIRMQQVEVTLPGPVTTQDNIRIDQKTGSINESSDTCTDITPRTGYNAAVVCGGISTVSVSFNGGHDSSELHGLTDGSPFPFPGTYQGGAGADALQSGGTGDTINGGADNDWVTFRVAGPAVDVSLIGGTASGQGGDTLAGIENAIGSDLDDTLRGDSAANALVGNDGDDELFGQAGVDVLLGNASNDDLHGGTGDDHLFGENGFDSLFGEDGGDSLEGGDGVDELSGGAGNDQLVGGPAGEPTAVDYLNLIDETVDVRVDLAAGTMSAPGLGSDTLDGLELILSGSGDDVLLGDDESNLFLGGRGRDLIVPRGGADTIVGDDLNDQDDRGIDTVSFADAPNGVTVEMGEGGNGTATGDGADSLAWHDGNNPTVENVVGSAHPDVISGDFDRNRLDGKGGNDDIDGDAGPDTLLGGPGRDDLAGEDGNDLLRGQSGADRGFGGRGGDRFFGGAGADRGIGGPGSDRLFGQTGPDFLAGNLHRDFLIGGPGADVFLGGLGNDVLRARDNRRDLRIACQAGPRDKAVVDLRPRDPNPAACEIVRRR